MGYMRKLIRNHKKLAALLIMPSALPGFIGWELAAPIRGRIATQLDLMRGLLRDLKRRAATPLARPRTSRPRRRTLIMYIHLRGE